MSETPCPFCPENWANLDIIWRAGDNIVLIPLNPVTDGHVLVVAKKHTADAAVNPDVASDLMFTAAMWVQRRGIQANIITSIGADATQTVRHTHIHIVPRHFGDGLVLPWTDQRRAEKCNDRMDGVLGDVHFCDEAAGHSGEHRRGNVTWYEVLR